MFKLFYLSSAVLLCIYGTSSANGQCYGIPPEGGACEEICGSCSSDCGECTTPNSGWICQEGSCPPQPSKHASDFPIRKKFKGFPVPIKNKEGPCYHGGQAHYVHPPHKPNTTKCICPNDTDPVWGRLIFGQYCEKKCDKECATQCIQCISGPEQVFDEDGCEQYCGGGGENTVFTDSCCYYSCGCDINKPFTDHGTPQVVSQCLDAGDDEDCMGVTIFDKCFRGTISSPPITCPPGFYCDYEQFGRGRELGICKQTSAKKKSIERKVQKLSTKKRKNVQNPDTGNEIKDPVYNVGCVYDADFGQVLSDTTAQKDCLKTTGRGISQEKIVHSNYNILSDYSVDTAPPLAFDVRDSSWENATKFYYDNITHPEGFKKHPEPVLRGVANGVKPNKKLLQNIHDFGPEIWQNVQENCKGMTFSYCYSYVTEFILAWGQ
jgi:hypothetical protein